MLGPKDALSAATKILTAKIELELAEVRSQLAEKDQRITKLEGEIRRKQEMEFRSGFCFSGSDQSPFCHRCWEADSVSVHLDKPFGHTLGGFGYECRRCKEVFRSETLLPGTVVLKQQQADSGVVGVGPRSSLREELDRFF